MRQTALCADGDHEDCTGRVMVGYPEQGSPTVACQCDCHTYYVANGDKAIVVKGRRRALATRRRVA